MEQSATAPMIDVHTAQLSQLADRYTDTSGTASSTTLMSRAAHAIAASAQDMLPKELNDYDLAVVVVTGPGNNGGDGCLAAQLLQERHIPTLLISRAELATLGQQLAESSPHLVIDALFGTGLSRPLDGIYASAVHTINTWRQLNPLGKVLSVDVPSGLSADGDKLDGPHVHADTTITFHKRKVVHVSEPGCFACGHVKCVDIGIVDAPDHTDSKLFAILPEQQPCLKFLKALNPLSHKGCFAHVGVVEGAAGMVGASRLAARAALRVGAGLVTLLGANNARGDLPEFMTRTEFDLSGIDVLVLGPGLTKKQSLGAAPGIPTVLDADALSLLLAPALKWTAPLIATPHPKEAAGLLGCTTAEIQQDRLGAIKQLLALPVNTQTPLVWVLKGACPIVASLQDGITFLEGGIPALSVGGSGDVLAGAIAGLIGQADSIYHSVLLAVGAHLAAGRKLSYKAQRGHFASEIADSLRDVLWSCSST